jgi:hypothetical protein
VDNKAIAATLQGVQSRLVNALHDLQMLTVDVLAEPPKPDGLTCPACGERERIEDTSTTGLARKTCLNCGRSWSLSKEISANG